MIETLIIIAGNGEYPALLARGARKAGVKRIAMLAVRGAASRWLLRPLADEFVPVGMGELGRVRDWCAAHKGAALMMAGGVPPTSMFCTRVDAFSLGLLRQLKFRNAHSMLGKICDVLAETGVRVLPASTFMDDALPAPGVLTARAPDERERIDIDLGHKVAMAIAALEIGQTVVTRQGATCAVEGLEGTNVAIRRGARLGGPGAVVVKVAKPGHDRRFDIPAFGMKTLKLLHRCKVSACAFQAGRTILLERAKVLEAANRWGIAIEALDSGLPTFPTRPED